MNAADRSQVAAVMRAVADLIEQDETVPVPETKIGFSVYGLSDGGPGIVRDIMAGLQGGWKSREIHDRGATYYDLTRKTGGVEIQIWTTAEVVGAQQGTRTVEVPAWQVSPEIAALLDEQEGQA